MKNDFKSQGYRYRVLGKLEFADVYYGKHNTTDEYISECLDAEIAGDSFLYIRKGDVFYFYVDEGANKDGLAEDVMYKHLAHEFPDETLLNSMYNCSILSENLYLLGQRTKIINT